MNELRWPCLVGGLDNKRLAFTSAESRGRERCEEQRRSTATKRHQAQSGWLNSGRAGAARTKQAFLRHDLQSRLSAASAPPTGSPFSSLLSSIGPPLRGLSVRVRTRAVMIPVISDSGIGIPVGFKEPELEPIPGWSQYHDRSRHHCWNRHHFWNRLHCWKRLLCWIWTT